MGVVGNPIKRKCHAGNCVSQCESSVGLGDMRRPRLSRSRSTQFSVPFEVGACLTSQVCVKLLRFGPVWFWETCGPDVSGVRRVCSSLTFTSVEKADFEFRTEFDGPAGPADGGERPEIPNLHSAFLLALKMKNHMTSPFTRTHTRSYLCYASMSPLCS